MLVKFTSIWLDFQENIVFFFACNIFFCRKCLKIECEGLKYVQESTWGNKKLKESGRSDLRLDNLFDKDIKLVAQLLSLIENTYSLCEELHNWLLESFSCCMTTEFGMCMESYVNQRSTQHLCSIIRSSQHQKKCVYHGRSYICMMVAHSIGYGFNNVGYDIALQLDKL